MSVAQAVSREFLGISVFIADDMTSGNFNHPSIPGRVQGVGSNAESSEVAIVLPDEGATLTMCIDTIKGVYVYTELCPGQLFLAKGPWTCLADIFDPDSIVHGVAYYNRAGVMTLGVFDASRLAGKDLRGLEVLDRHVRVHEVLHRKPLPGLVQYHWAGFAHCCYAHITRDTNPFTAHQMLVLGSNGVNRRVLGPLLTGHALPDPAPAAAH